MFGPLSRSDLRVPGDVLILYYLYTNGTGATSTIAATIDRKPDYVTQRLSALKGDDLALITTVGGRSSEVTLTERGVAVARELPDYHLADYRDQIEAATPYTVSWE